MNQKQKFSLTVAGFIFFQAFLLYLASPLAHPPVQVLLAVGFLVADLWVLRRKPLVGILPNNGFIQLAHFLCLFLMILAMVHTGERSPGMGLFATVPVNLYLLAVCLIEPSTRKAKKAE